MVVRAVAVALCVWTACGDGGGVSVGADASSDSEVEVPGDDAAPACGTTWSVVDLPATGIRLADPARVNAARTVRVVVDAEIGGCDMLAPARVGYIEGSAVATVQMRVWRPSGDCPAPARKVRRPVELRLTWVTSWRIEAAGTPQSVELQVYPAPDRVCGAIDGCEMDCDCADGERCLGGSGLGGPFMQCAAPCELDLDCASGVCASLADGLAFSCQQSTPQCGAGLSCGRGYSCVEGVCEAEFSLDAHLRTECGCDSDCAEGLRCVDPQVPGQPRRCEVACPTGSSGWCSAGHVCGGPEQDLAGLAAAGPVCVSTGE